VNSEVMTDPDSWYFMDGILVLMADFAFVAYLLGSELVRDVFKDFPSPTKAVQDKFTPHS
jgi:hypothetical protein